MDSIALASEEEKEGGGTSVVVYDHSSISPPPPVSDHSSISPPPPVSDHSSISLPPPVSDHSSISLPPPVSDHSSISSPPADMPPSPPPLPLDVGSPARRMRSFYWKPIPEESVHQCGAPNVWTLGQAAGKQFHIDIRNLEELFAQREDGRLHKAINIKASQACRTLQEPKSEITILDSKRSMNLAIFLKRFKKSYKSIIEDILHGNSAVFGPEVLRELLKLLPESAEVEKFHSYEGDPEQLAKVDSFMYHFTRLPSFGLRVEALLLKEEFPTLSSSLKQDICTVRSAARELLSCAELHAVLHLVLDAGNILNSGGYGGNAAGFKLSSLLSLADTKANKPGMNLLHFVALEAKKRGELLKFPEKLQHIEGAARVSVEDLAVECESLRRRTQHMEQNSNPDLQEQLYAFLQSSATVLEDLCRSRSELQKEGEDLIDFFCEDKDTFRLDDCFHIFQTFCSKFKKAVEENMEREHREESRIKRLRELEEKRRSWADGEMVHGVFGSRCSSETDVRAALKKEGLSHLLRSRPKSVQGPSSLGQYGRLRASWQLLSDGDSDSAGSDTYKHSSTLRQAATSSNSDLHSAAVRRQAGYGHLSVHVETHTLVPALQTFNLRPLLDDNHHGNSLTSYQDDITMTTLEVNNKVELQSDTQSNKSRNSSKPEEGAVLEAQQTVQIRSKTQMDKIACLKHSEDKEENGTHTNLKYNKELKVSDCAVNDLPDGKTTRDSSESHNHTSKPTSHALASSKESHIKTIREENNKQVCRSPNQTSHTTKSLRKMTSCGPIISSTSSKTSSFPKPPPLRPVRTLTPSENQSMRRVVGLNRTPGGADTARDVSRAPQTSTHTVPPVQRSSTHTTPPSQRSSTRTTPPSQRSSTHTTPSPSTHTTPPSQRSSTRTTPPSQRSSTHTTPSPSTHTTPPSQRSSTHTTPPSQRSSTHTTPPSQRSSTRTTPPSQRSSTHTTPPSQRSSTRTTPPSQRSSTRTTPPSQRSSTRTTPPSQRSSTRTTPPSQRSSSRTTPPSQRSSSHTTPPSQRSSTHTTPPSQRSSTHTTPPSQRSSTHTTPPSQRSSTCTTPPSQRSSSRTTPPSQRSSTHTALQRSSVRKSVVQQNSMPEEKMCRSTLRALAQAGEKSSGASHKHSAQNHAPSFAQNTVASTTRNAIASGNLPVSTPEVPSLNRTTSLRLSQNRMNPQIMRGSKPNPGKAGSVCLPPASGHKRKNMTSFFATFVFSQPSRDKSLKPAWK